VCDVCVCVMCVMYVRDDVFLGYEQQNDNDNNKQ